MAKIKRYIPSSKRIIHGIDENKTSELALITTIGEKNTLKFKGKTYTIYQGKEGIFLPIEQHEIYPKILWKIILSLKEHRKGRYYAISYYDIQEIFTIPKSWEKKGLRVVGGYISNGYLLLWQEDYQRQIPYMKNVLRNIMRKW